MCTFNSSLPIPLFRFDSLQFDWRLNRENLVGMEKNKREIYGLSFALMITLGLRKWELGRSFVMFRRLVRWWFFFRILNHTEIIDWDELERLTGVGAQWMRGSCWRDYSIEDYILLKLTVGWHCERVANLSTRCRIKIVYLQLSIRHVCRREEDESSGKSIWSSKVISR